MADLKATQSTDKNDWETPWWLVHALERKLNIPHFDLDPAATNANRKAVHWYTEATDGLLMPWEGNVFVNPPYSGIKDWVAKGFGEAKAGRANVTMLIASRTDTRWWWDYVRHGYVYFIKGRIRFTGAASGAPFPSAIVRFMGIGGWFSGNEYWDVRKEEGQ